MVSVKFFEHLLPDPNDMSLTGGPSSYDFTHAPVGEKFMKSNAANEELNTIYMSPKTMPLTPHLDLMSPELKTKKQSLPTGPMFTSKVDGSRVMLLH